MGLLGLLVLWSGLVPSRAAGAALIHCRSAQPTGLLVDFKRQPSLGVRARPTFAWIVPACSPTAADHRQTAYQIVVSTAAGGRTKPVIHWDSGRVASNASTSAEFGGAALLPGARYTWTVTTWTTSPAAPESPACQSEPSDPALLITSLGDSVAWDASAKFLTVPGQANATFSYFRKELSVPPGCVSASAFVTAVNQDPLLSAYKLYINGALVNLGPGRGEAPVFDGDGVFRSLPYYTLDVTDFFAPAAGMTVTVALQSMYAPVRANNIARQRLTTGDVVPLFTLFYYQSNILQ